MRKNIILFLIVFLGGGPLLLFSGGNPGKLSSGEILQLLPADLPGGEFSRAGIRTGQDGKARAVYRGPSGLLLNLELDPLKTPPATLEDAQMHRLEIIKKLKDNTGKLFPGKWIITRKELSFPGLAGKTLSGIWMRALLGKEELAARWDIFLTVYRERLLQISILIPEKAIHADAQERIFRLLLSQVAKLLYEGEKAKLAPFRKKLFWEAYRQLMQEPEKAALACHAITKFVERSSAVMVRMDNKDFPWQKELLKKNPEGKRAFFLLLNAYMGGNAAEQLRSGICRDCRDAGMDSMKKMYRILRQKNLLSMQIPELEK